MEINHIRTVPKNHKFFTIKQGDKSSTVTLNLYGPDGLKLTGVSGTGEATLLDTFDKEVRMTAPVTVTGGELTFKVTQQLKANPHTLEIEVGGKKYPSGDDFVVYVTASHDMAEINIIQQGTKEAVIAQIMSDLNAYVTPKVTDYLAANASKFKGEPFKYSDFTTAQLNALKVKGDPGSSAYEVAKSKGFAGTEAQWLESLKVKGDKGDAFKYSDFTQSQLDALKVKGDQGKSAYEVAKSGGYAGTESQWLASLKGDKGDKGDGLQIDGVVATVGELPSGTTRLTYLVGTTLYFRQAGQSTWTKGVDIKGVDGKPGSVVTIGADGYWYIDNVKTAVQAKPSQAELDRIKLYVQSRGENLVTNGTGLLGDNTNFSGLTYKTDEVKVGKGSFYAKDFVSVFSDEYIPVDVSKTYEISLWAKSLNAKGGSYIGIACYDIDGKVIQPIHFFTEGKKAVTLTQPLKKGDTKVYVSDASQWAEEVGYTNNPDYRALVLWGYKNSGGYLYPEGYYSQYAQMGITNVDTVNNVLTLKTPWVYEYKETSDKVFPIGHKLTRSRAASNYPYPLRVGQTIPQTWTQFKGKMNGESTDAGSNTNFRPATSTIKIFTQLNQNAVDETWLSGIDFKEVDSNYAPVNHTHDDLIKLADGQAYKIFKDDGTIPNANAVDLNAPETKLTKSGVYYATGATNYPTGTSPSGYITYEVYAGSYAKMYYSPYHTSDVYMKTKYNTWSAWSKINGADLSNYYDKSQLYTKTEVDTTFMKKTDGYTKKEVDDKVAAIPQPDLSGYQKTATAFTKDAADKLYAPIGTTGGTSTPAPVNTQRVNANQKFGFVGDGVTDNYQPFKDMLAFNEAHPWITIEFDGEYNNKQAEYRVDRYVTIKNIEGEPESTSPTHMIWKAKRVHLITNGAKFINMPMNGFTKNKTWTNGDRTFHYAKEEPITLFNFELNDHVLVDELIVDGENHKLKFATGFTSKENDNPRWSDNIPLAEGRGHGVVFNGTKNVTIHNLVSNNAVVDGVAIAFNSNLGTMTVEQSTNYSLTNVTTTGCGRLGVSGLGCHAGEIVNFRSEYNGCNKNAAGQYVYYSPAGGTDIEPHHSPIAMDNISPTNYKVEDWNGNMVIRNARIRYNSGTQIACTSTLLTRNVIFERCTVRPPKDRKVDHQLIQSSLQNCKFIDMDVDGKLSDGALSRVMFYGAGYVSESTGVITGQAANVWSEVVGGKWANIEPWVNTDGNSTHNEINTGEYGLHNISFTGLVMENVKFTLRTIRRFNFNNVVMNYPSDSAITRLFIWTANMKDCVIINRKSSNILLDLGNGDSQSNFENLRITTGKFDWASGTKKYKTATIPSENLDVYDYTRQMEYVLGNATGTPTQPTDTTPPAAPTVNAVYTNSTTVTGTAEANSTVTATFNGANAKSATANGSGAYSISTSGVTLTTGMTVSVTAKDAAGNTSTAKTVTVQAVADTTAPNFLSGYPKFDSTNQNISIWADEESTATVTRPDGSTGTVALTGSSGQYSGLYSISSYPDGTYKVELKDAAGNKSSQVSLVVSRVTPDTTAPTFTSGYPKFMTGPDRIVVYGSESGTAIITRPNSTTTTLTLANSGGWNATYNVQSSDADGTYKVQLRDEAGNTSSQVNVTVTKTVTASTNLLGAAFTNTAAVTEGWGKRKALNSNLSLNWNGDHGGIAGTAGWTIAKDKIAFLNLAYDGTTTGTTNSRFIYFKFEGYKPSTVYSFSADVSYTATDDINMLGGTQFGVNPTPKRVSMTFKTDVNGSYGYKWDGDVRYGTKADGSTIAPFQDASIVNKEALKINQTLTLDKMMLNEGATALPYTPSS